jgi:hypothetical protein
MQEQGQQCLAVRVPTGHKQALRHKAEGGRALEMKLAHMAMWLTEAFSRKENSSAVTKIASLRARGQFLCMCRTAKLCAVLEHPSSA